MGQLFTRISTSSSDQQITDNNFGTVKPIITKRKYIDQDNISKKRKLDQNDRLPSSPRISKFMKSSLISHPLSPMISFKCQLCRHCFANKDSYLDHMILCAIERHASIKIVRAPKTYSIRF